jgi:hypothetical protein
VQYIFEQKIIIYKFIYESYIIEAKYASSIIQATSSKLHYASYIAQGISIRLNINANILIFLLNKVKFEVAANAFSSGPKVIKFSSYHCNINLLSNYLSQHFK